MSQIITRKRFGYLALSLLAFLVLFTLNARYSQKNRLEKLGDVRGVESRDFIKYKCKDIRRIGGQAKYLKESKDALSRVDGAWYVCFDVGLAPIEQKCTVLSFGVSYDDSFDKEMHDINKCIVFSFDPYVESARVVSMREKKPKLYKNSVDVQLDSKWKFLSAGIVGSLKAKTPDNKLMLTFDGVLSYLKLENQIIDVFKMDIEGGEFDVISSLDMDYVCKYVKQFMIETHPVSPRTTKEQPPLKYFKILSKLEKCFSLFMRHTRFFLNEGRDTEWQVESGFKLDLKRFQSENDLATFMFIYGELYFINENFLT